MTIELTSITVVHPWTKERRSLPVETVTRTTVTLRWGIAGLYQLDLRTNQLTPRSPSAKRRAKGKACWEADDIESVRYAVKVHVDGEDKKAETARLAKAHYEAMPGQRKEG